MRLLALVFGYWVYKPFSLLVRLVLLARGVKVGEGFYIEAVPRLQLNGRSGNVRLGNNVTIRGDIDLRNRENGTIVIEDNVSFDTGCRVVAAREAVVTFKERADIGLSCIFNCGADLTVGEGVMVGGYAYVQSSNHGTRIGEPIQNQPYSHAPITIGSEAWLGGNVTVLPGARIGDGAVIGAKALVNSVIPDFAIAVGIPAAVIGLRKA